MASKVYYMNDRAGYLSESIPFKALKLCRDIGIDQLVKPGYKVAIKTHMGEYGNAFNLRPQWVKVIVDEVKRLGGFPTVLDCNTIATGVAGARAIEADHLKTASAHGFNEATLGCPVIIADGAYGFDDVEVPVPHGVYMKHTWMGKRLTEFDACIVVSHFKGHAQGVYGGAIKNIGIGMGSKHGKMATHFWAHPVYGIPNADIVQENARKAAVSGTVKRTRTGAVMLPLQEGEISILDTFIKSCPRKCFEWTGDEVIFHREKCTACGNCLNAGGNYGGLFKYKTSLPALWPTLIADAASGYLHAIGKDRFLFVNYCFDITPLCDCCTFHDRPMIPNLGVFVSRDPVAVDMACLEACEAASVVPGSRAEEYGFSEPNTDRFTNCSSAAQISQWTQINSAVYNGMGSSEYELVESVPGPEFEYWPEQYTRDNTFYDQHMHAFEADTFRFDEYYLPEQQLSNDELYKRPAGLVKVSSIQDRK